jgi:hypothetical protein
MSEQNKPGAEGAPAAAPNPANDEIKNLKAEMSRKMSNLEATNAKLMEQLQSLVRPAASEPKAEKPIKDLIWDDPEAALAIVEERAEKRVMSKVEKAQKEQQRQQATLSALVSEFPELGYADHDLTRTAVEKYNALSDDEKLSPVAYKAAVNEAALELGIKPKSRRKETDDDSYTVGSSGRSTPAPKKEKLSQDTIAFAQAMGLNVNDEKLKERLRTNHGRKSYTRYE